jgi:hypothetical protein
MFDLEKSISEWRKRMIAAGIETPVPLEELESHLREDIEKQICSGTDTEQAFHCAVQRIGQGEGLQREFEKLEDAKRRRGRELLRRWSVIAGTGFVYAMMAWTWYIGVRQGKFEITLLEILLAAGVAAPMILFGWSGRSLAKHLPLMNDNWVLAIAFGALFLAALLFRTFFPVISPVNVVHLQIAVLWCLSPLLGFGNCVSAWHERCEAFRKSTHKQTA